jgi:hypothetical protein
MNSGNGPYDWKVVLEFPEDGIRILRRELLIGFLHRIETFGDSVSRCDPRTSTDDHGLTIVISAPEPIAMRPKAFDDLLYKVERGRLTSIRLVWDAWMGQDTLTIYRQDEKLRAFFVEIG